MSAAPPAMTEILRTEGLSKSYRRRKVVNQGCLRIHEGEVAGLSWLIPPHRSTSSARALELVRAIGIDAVCLRRKRDADPAFGYAMMMRFVPVLVERLSESRLQMLDVYGKSS